MSRRTTKQRRAARRRNAAVASAHRNDSRRRIAMVAGGLTWLAANFASFAFYSPAARGEGVGE